MSSASWITTTSCSSSVIHFSEESTVSAIVQRLGFFFLSPCPQRVLFSSVDVIFLFVLVVFAVHKLYQRFISNDHSTSELNSVPPRTTLWFKITLIFTGLLAFCYIAVSISAFTRSIESSWMVFDGLFWLVRAIPHAVIAILIIHEKRFQAVTHPLSLRVYWFLNFIFVILFTVSGIIRFFSGDESQEPSFRIDDIASTLSFPLSIFLVYVANDGSIWIIPSRVSEQGTAEVETNLDKPDSKLTNVTGYASASVLSKAFWIWMNPLLSKGYKTSVKLDDVPYLSPDHRAERMSELFEGNWPKPEDKSNHPVLVALVRTFWWRIALTAFLAVIRLIVMYVGPMLIKSFVNFTADKNRSPNEGYYLILILLCAKFIEVLCTHQFNFNTLMMGMLIRNSLITSLYKKGLRLSFSARQSHGVGQIVNYMSVDARQLSDMMPQLHALWMLPFQVVISLVLLYQYLGTSVLAATVGVLGVILFSVFNTRRNNSYQHNIMMKRDARLKATNEMLNYMRVIKFQAWEEHFNRRIQAVRESEFGWLTKFMYSIALNFVVMWSTTLMIAAITFGVAILMGVPLDSGTVFTTTTVVRTLQEPIRTFPQALISVSQAMISLRRLDRFMLSKELVGELVEREEGCHGSVAVEVKDGVFSWDDESAEEVLKNINLTIKKGQLATIVGTVGSGKSSLLGSLIGEMHKISGMVRVCGKTAYVAQTSWIQNGTIKENILFGLPMDREKYNEVIRVCSLEKDLKMMDYGDQTEIGERGINLSGGQKQRIQLARAVYQDCDVYLLDDVFSAVDAHTGSDLFKECVRGALKNKTIVLVTHQVDFLHNVDVIVVMRDGMIVQSGKYDELLESGLDFGALVAAHETSMDFVEIGQSAEKVNSPRPQRSLSSSSHEETIGENNTQDQPKSENGTAKLIKEEEKETGKVGLNVYKQYFTEAYGWWGAAVVLLLSVVWQGTLMTSDYWLAYETSDERNFKPVLFISIYAAIGVASFLVVAARSISVTIVGLKTSQGFFSQILNSILHAPMSFFDTTPSGRILSRASTDQFNVDCLLPIFLGLTISMYITVVGIFIVTIQYAWPAIFLVIPLAWLNVWYRGYFLATSRELTRLDSITKAPIIHHFSESISGVMTIRAFNKQGSFNQENIRRVNANLRMDFHNNGSNEWLGFRLELLGAIVMCISTMFMILLPSSVIKPENVGLSLSYGLSLNAVMFWAVNVSCFVENRMVSVERIKQYSVIPSEAPWEINDRRPPPNWPSHGNVELKDLQVRYRPNTPLVLKGITLSINGGEKIGVVGRTGSGKSTLIQVMFRLVEPTGGRIIVDGIDICMLGLHEVRSRFGIIPQEPVLFEGTVRSNVDPIGVHSDEEIWKSLERCQLKDVVASKPEKLDALVIDNGDNWSVGQRQLLCLGRVMLKRSRLLFMDEATASVDSQTDAVIQKIIREDFAACTIVSIAHRIPTVMDCDRVLVIDAGRAKEFDSPSRLLERPSLFGALVQEYANRSSEL